MELIEKVFINFLLKRDLLFIIKFFEYINENI